MKNKTTYLSVVVSFLSLLVFTFLLSSCESSRVGPEIPRPNPPAAPQAALVMGGSVVDSKTGGGVFGATVEIFKADGTKVATTTTDNVGGFLYDISNVNAAILKVTATASGYGFAFVNAKVDLTNRSAQAVTIPIDKIVSTSVTLTPTGGTATTPSTESKANQPVTITVPPAAVAQNTTIQVAQVPVNNVPAPTNSGSNTQVGIANLQPAGVTFSKAVTLSFPLPYKFKVGDKIQLNEFANGAWQSSTLSATVDNTGYIANVDITKTAQYSLLDNTKISGSFSGSIISSDGSIQLNSLSKDTKVLEERSFSFSSGTLNVTLPGSFVMARTFSNVAIEAPTDEWLFNTLEQRYGSVFARVTAPGTYPYNVLFNVPWPGAAANPNKLNADGSGNKNRPGESGDWSLKVVYGSVSVQVANIVLDNTGYWTVTVTATNNGWTELRRTWVWTPHNQGGITFEY